MPASIGRTVFRIGEGDLILDTEDQAFTSGFRRIYGDCESTAALAPLSARLAVTPGGVAVHVDVLHPIGVDLVTFLETAFADRGCRRASCDEPGWTGLACDSPNVHFRVRQQRVTFPADGPWEGIAANLGLGLVMRQQRNVVFLHASTVMLAGSARGVVFVGHKAAGKTTTALGMAMRGHEFLGDEVVGIRQDGSLLPIRRAISKREGPCASGIESALEGLDLSRSVYPDGLARTVVPAGQLFAPPSRPATMDAMVFLDGFAGRPALTPAVPSWDLASRLQPVMNCLGDLPPAARVFALLRLLGRARTYTLKLGPPDDTCDLLEQHFASR